jgi:hypothetical protein
MKGKRRKTNDGKTRAGCKQTQTDPPKPQMQYPGILPAVKSQSKWFRKSASTEDASVVADFMI